MNLSNLEQEHVLQLFRAANFAAEKHQYLRRSGYQPLPYINHLMKVTQILIEIEKETDIQTLQAALLHDVIEDTDVTFEDITQAFGMTVAEVVEELTDDMEIPYKQRKQLQIDGANQLSLPAQKIRIADKGSNILDMLAYPVNWPRKRKITYVDFSIQVISNIIGYHPRLTSWFDSVLEKAKSELEIV